MRQPLQAGGAASAAAFGSPPALHIAEERRLVQDAAASPGFALARRLAKAGLRNPLFWRRFEVLKDLAKEKERRRPQAHEDGKPLGPAFASLLETAADLVILGLPGPPPGH